MASLAILGLLTVGLTLSAAQLSFGQNLIGTVHTTRPGGSSILNNDLEVTLTLKGQSLASSSYATTATPTFAAGPQNTFSNPSIFGTGNYLKVTSQFTNSSASPGGPVAVDLKGSINKTPFSGPGFLASKTLTSRWYEQITTARVPGVFTGAGPTGSGGWHWVFVNGEWVQISPVGGPVIELMVTFGMVKEPGSQPGEQQLMVANGYRLDAVAQEAIANHFGAMDLEIEMVRDLGSGITGMGLPGDIGYYEFGSHVVDAGDSFEAEFGALPSSPSELMLLQVFATFVSPGADQLPETVEYWVAYTGDEVSIPEPAALGITSTAIVVLCLRRKRRRIDRRLQKRSAAFPQ